MARHRVHSSVELAQLLNPSKMATVYDVDRVIEDFNALLNPRNYLSVFEGFTKERIGSIPALILSTLGDRPSLFYWFSENISEINIMALSNILSKIIIELSNFFIEHPLAPSIPEQIAMIHEHRRIANHAPHLLQGLFALTTVAEDPKARLVSSSTTVKAKIPRRVESATKTALRTFVDDEAETFRAFEMPIPTNVNQVEAVLSTLRQRLCDILEFYKPILRLPEFMQTIKSHIADNAAHASATANPTSGTNMTSDDYILEPVSAFPSVQPLKSAMYFENAEGFGNWKLLISSRADSDLRACSRKDRASFRIVVKKMKSLSHGHFSADNQKTLSHSTKGVPIYEAKMTGDTRIIYHVDLLEEEEEEVSSYTHQTTMNSGDVVRQILTQVLKIIGVMYTHSHVDNTNWDAISRQLGRRGKEYRKYCTIRGSPLRHGNDTCPPAIISKACVENDAQGATLMEALELPPDDLEQLHTFIGQEKYVEFSKQLLFNMLAGLDDEFPFTVSSEERKVIEDPTSCYVLGRSGTGKTITILYKMVTVERSYQLSPQDIVKPRQLFVTCSRVLVKKVEKRFKQLMDALKTTALSPEELKQLAISRASAQVELVDEENRMEWRSDLPSRFSELEDKHFPLFIAYDDICTMLEADLLPSARRRSRLDYKRFRREYWEHLPQNLRKSLDPSLVFSEIIGAVCGSEQTLHTPNGYLDLQAYQDLSGRTHSTFAEKRVQLHSVFLEVLKKKRQLQDRHAAERTHDLLRAFKGYDRPVPKVHYLYVDEVQDHLLIDAKLLRSLCDNPNGLFWAGDTAQTISRGSTFSFNELKSFLHRIEENRVTTSEIFQTVHKPSIHHLTMNYRSHSGIVNAAGSIVELLEKFFPDSIDKLQRERSLTPGLNPIFFEGSIWKHRDTLFPKSGTEIAFGAEQCILVRDEKARERLEEEIGKSGLILHVSTIHESKGLEFNDVLIYNFFHDSDIDLACWAAVLNAVNSQSPLPQWHVPTFSESRHSGLCIELKILYVGITRARNKLWIADESDKGEPIRVFWSSRGLITNSLPNHTPIIHQSTPEQWKEKGDELFSKRHFKHAKQCYQKAELPHAVAIANAYALLEDAEQTPTSAAAESSRAFKKAATAFSNCSQDPRNTARKDVYLYEAGRCFEQSSNITEALKAYSLCKAYDQVARLCMEGRMFDEARKTILRYPEQIKEFERIKEKLRDHYFAEEDFGALHSLFEDLDEQIKYFKIWKPSLKSRLLVYHNKFEEAAELERHEGNWKKAVELFLRARNYMAAKTLILQALWHATSFKSNFATSTCDLFDIAQDLRTNVDCWTRAEINELDMFGLILSSSSDERDAKLAKFGQAFNIARRALPCWSSLDQYFFNMPSRFQRDHDVFQIHGVLVHFLTYVTSLKILMAKERPMSDLAKLFGFRFSESQAEQVLVPSTWHRPQSSKPGDPPFVPISNQHFAERARNKLDELLSTRLQVEEECLKSHTRFQPCLCSQEPTCDRFHVDSCRLNISAYLACIAGHLTQILILSATKSARGTDFPIPVKIFWMERIFRLLHCFGSSFTVAWDSNSQHKEAFSAGIGVAKVWIRDILSSGFLPPASLLTFALSAMDFVTRFAEKESSLRAILPQLRQLIDLSEKRTDRPLMPEDHSRQARLKDILPVDMYREILKPRSEVNQGPEFLCEVVKMNYSIDLEVFFTVFERVCAVFTMSYYREKYQMYSGLILPRNWLYLATCTTIEKFQNGDLDKIHLVFKALLEGLCLDQAFGQLLLDGYPEGLSDSLRNRFLLRTFTSVALVGLNTLDDHFLSKILSLTQELWWACDLSRYSPLVQRFFQAADWFEMDPLVRESLQNSPHQELIQIGMQIDPVPEGMDGVRLVTFRNFKHLHSMLSQPPEVSSPPPEFSGPPPETPTEEGSGPASREADAAPPSADVLVTEPEPMAEQSIAELPPESYIKACIIIEKYREKILHIHGAEAVSLKSEDTYEYHYRKCLEHVKSANLVHPPYKVRFLATVPHLLFALHSAQDGLYTRKQVIKKLRSPLKPESTGGEPVDFALLAEEQTKINSLLKVLGSLAAKVELTSDMHVTQDVNKLRETAHEALAVLKSVVTLCPIDKEILASIGELERVRL